MQILLRGGCRSCGGGADLAGGDACASRESVIARSREGSTAVFFSRIFGYAYEESFFLKRVWLFSHDLFCFAKMARQRIVLSTDIFKLTFEIQNQFPAY